MHSTWAVEKANLKKFSLDQDQICLFNCSSWKNLKLQAFYGHICYIRQFTPNLFHMYPSSKKLNSPWQLELFPHQKYKIWKGVNRSQCSFNRRDSLELLHCLILHYCIDHLVLPNSNYKFFTDTYEKWAWMSFLWIKLLVQATGKRQKIISLQILQSFQITLANVYKPSHWTVACVMWENAWKCDSSLHFPLN